MTLEQPQLASLRAPTAIFLGTAIGLGLSYAVLFVLGLMFLWVLVWFGVPGSQSYAEAHRYPSYLAFAHLVGFLCLVEAGRWTSRFSRSLPIRNAALAGAGIAAVTALGNLVPYEMPIPFWSKVASIALPIPALVLGAFLERRTV